jgi:hypothetical protein
MSEGIICAKVPIAKHGLARESIESPTELIRFLKNLSCKGVIAPAAGR